MEKLNLLINNIPHYEYKNRIIYDSNIDMMTRGSITYLSDGNESDLFNFCDVNEYKINSDKKYLFVLSIHALDWVDFADLLSNDNDFGKLIRDILFAKNVKCLFVDMHESDDLQKLKVINRIFSRYNIDKSSVWFMNNDSNMEDFVKQNKLGLQVKKIHHLATTFPHSLFYNNFEISEKSLDGDFFISVNKRAKPHRVLLLAHLYINDLLDKTNFSLLDTINIEDDEFDHIIDREYYYKIKNDIDYILSLRPRQTKYESVNNTDLLNTEKYVFAGIIDLEDYIEPIVNITSESMYNSECIHITEKSFKAFGLGQLPIIIASPGHIKKMKEHYGFDFFDDIIDHSYDSEYDHKKRFTMIVDELKRLYNNKEELINFYNLNKSRFIENRNLLQKVCGEKWDYKFFKEVIVCQ